MQSHFKKVATLKFTDTDRDFSRGLALIELTTDENCFEGVQSRLNVCRIQGT
jgi:hypothetical protein